MRRAKLRTGQGDVMTDIDLTQFDTGEHRVACPQCGRGGRDKTLGISVKALGDVVAHCFRCDYAASLREDKPTFKPSIKPARVVQDKHTTLAEWAEALWRDCRPLSGVAIDYLKARRCVIPPADGDLRVHPALKHPSGHVGPALVALVTDFETNEPLSLHRTWIEQTGKADVSPNRMLLGNHTAKGGVIRLWPDTDVTMGLAVGEGIESCLAFAHGFEPVWSAVSAGNMADLPVLSGIEALTVIGDADRAGVEAANALADRWHEAGVYVQVVMPSKGDVNDYLMEAL